MEQVALARLDLVQVAPIEQLAQDQRARDDYRSTLRLEGRDVLSLFERERGEAVEQTRRRRGRDPVTVDAIGVVLVEPEVERRERRDRARDTDRVRVRERRRQDGADVLRARAELVAARRVRVQETLGQADAADVEA